MHTKTCMSVRRIYAKPHLKLYIVKFLLHELAVELFGTSLAVYYCILKRAGLQLRLRLFTR